MGYFHRNIATECLLLAKSYPVISLLGPRQSGKTTLVKQLFPNKPYISLEDLDQRQFAAMDPRGFLDRFPEGAIFDEIQREPSLLSYIQGIVDKHNIPGMFILTGSHQLQLHESISQSLAGRTAILKLLPFCLSELPVELQNRELDYYLFHGMYPRIYQSNLKPNVFYSNYLQTYIERDLRLMINIKDLGLFQRFIKLCASRIGQIFNSHSIANELGVSSNTIKQWLSILEASFVIFLLQPYFENFGKRIIKSPKLYFTDLGLAAHCLDINLQQQIARDPLRGNLVENFVLTELIKHQFNRGLTANTYFYRDSNQNEIDVIFKSGHQLLPIEIKSSKTFHPSFLKGIHYFNALVGERSQGGFVVYAGDIEQKISGIHVIHYKHLNKIFEL